MRRLHRPSAKFSPRIYSHYRMSTLLVMQITHTFLSNPTLRRAAVSRAFLCFSLSLPLMYVSQAPLPHPLATTSDTNARQDNIPTTAPQTKPPPEVFLPTCSPVPSANTALCAVVIAEDFSVGLGGECFGSLTGLPLKGRVSACEDEGARGAGSGVWAMGRRWKLPMTTLPVDFFLRVFHTVQKNMQCAPINNVVLFSATRAAAKGEGSRSVMLGRLWGRQEKARRKDKGKPETRALHGTQTKAVIACPKLS